MYNLRNQTDTYESILEINIKNVSLFTEMKRLLFGYNFVLHTVARKSKVRVNWIDTKIQIYFIKCYTSNNQNTVV